MFKSIRLFLKDNKDIFLLALLAFILFTWKIGSTPILDGDTAFMAQLAKNIIKTGDWMTPRFMPDTPLMVSKPPLVPWLMAISFKIFGINEFALSFWHSILAVLAVIFTYFLSIQFFSKRCALLSGLVLLTSAQFFYQSRSPLQDIPLTLFTLGSILFFIVFDLKKKSWALYLSFAFLALSLLAKGPAGFVFPGFIIFLYVLLNGKITGYLNKDFFYKLILGLVIFLAISLPWFVNQYIVWGNDFLMETFSGTFGRFFKPVDLVADLETISPQYDFYNYPLQLFLLVIPWSGFVYPAMLFLINRRKNIGEKSILIYISVIFLVMTFSLNYKISRYLLPMFPPMAIMIAKLLDDYIGDEKLRGYINWSNFFNFFLVIPILSIATIYMMVKFPETQAAYRPIILPVVFILSLGLIVSSILLALKKIKPSIISFALTGLIAYFMLVPLADFYFIKANPIKPFSLKIKELYKPGDRVFKYMGREDHFMFFYGDTPVDVIKDPKEMEKELRNTKTKVYAITEEPDALKSVKKLKIVAKQNNFVLFSN